MTSKRIYRFLLKQLTGSVNFIDLWQPYKKRYDRYIFGRNNMKIIVVGREGRSALCQLALRWKAWCRFNWTTKMKLFLNRYYKNATILCGHRVKNGANFKILEAGRCCPIRYLYFAMTGAVGMRLTWFQPFSSGERVVPIVRVRNPEYSMLILKKNNSRLSDGQLLNS